MKKIKDVKLIEYDYINEISITDQLVDVDEVEVEILISTTYTKNEIIKKYSNNRVEIIKK